MLVRSCLGRKKELKNSKFINIQSNRQIRNIKDTHTHTYIHTHIHTYEANLRDKQANKELKKQTGGVVQRYEERYAQIRARGQPETKWPKIDANIIQRTPTARTHKSA